jgi:hypothetical protein
MAENGNGDFSGKREENRDGDGHWRSTESQERSLKNLRPFSDTYRPTHPGRPKGSGLKRELLKALRTRLQSDPLHRPMVRLIAQAMVKAAAKGNVQAAMFIRDEVDGRLPRPMEGELPPSQIFVTVETGVSRFGYEPSEMLERVLKPKPDEKPGT